MSNFKTKMTENKKTEKWSSLRLELQEFAPQEFVAACWILRCDGYGNSYKYIRTSNVHNSGSYVGIVDEEGSHVVDTKQQENAPSPPSINNGYLWEQVKNNGGGMPNVGVSTLIHYYSYEGKFHLTSLPTSKIWESDNHS